MKRLLDIIFGVILLVILSPLFLIIAILIKLDSKGPIFFTQMRIGKNNELFKIYKFRTMKIGTPDLPNDKLVNAESYITSLGKFLRRTSLDEIPQLMNIVKGEMTFVGPRPVVYNSYSLKDLRTQAGVHILLPGVTGWAQINGRDHNDDVQKTKLDKYYLENKSLLLDIKIVLLTILKVITREGIAEGYNPNMEGIRIKEIEVPNNASIELNENKQKISV